MERPTPPKGIAYAMIAVAVLAIIAIVIILFVGKKSPPSDGSDGDPCKVNADCKQSGYCANKMCSCVPLGNPCTSGQECCASGACTGGLCAVPSSGPTQASANVLIGADGVGNISMQVDGVTVWNQDNGVNKKMTFNANGPVLKIWGDLGSGTRTFDMGKLFTYIQTTLIPQQKVTYPDVLLMFNTGNSGFSDPTSNWLCPQLQLFCEYNSAWTDNYVWKSFVKSSPTTYQFSFDDLWQQGIVNLDGNC